MERKCEKGGRERNAAELDSALLLRPEEPAVPSGREGEAEQPVVPLAVLVQQTQRKGTAEKLCREGMMKQASAAQVFYVTVPDCRRQPHRSRAGGIWLRIVEQIEFFHFRPVA